MTRTLRLVNSTKGLLAESTAPGTELEYYSLDGEGGRATQCSFTPWNEDLVYVGIDVDYDDSDDDDFWAALEEITAVARRKGVALPDYAI